VRDPNRQRFLVDKVSVEPSSELSRGASGGFLSRVEIIDADGRVTVGEPKAPPGHVSQPLTDRDFEQKLHENVAPLFGSAHASQLVKAVWSLDAMEDLRELTVQLVLGDSASIDKA
jgi:hypothetical protein